MKFSSYLDKEVLESTICESVVFGSEIFHTALLIKDLSLLKDTFLRSINNQISENDYKKLISPFIFESYTDAFKICVFFENYLKARLLQNGYIIHKIKANPNYSSLSKKQQTQPISLTDLLNHDKESLTEPKEIILNSSLTNCTLSISTMLEFKYNEIIRLPAEILKTVKILTNKRNEIHFLNDWEFIISTSLLNNLEIMLSFVRNQIQSK